MDPIAHATANLALQRPRDAALIEVSTGGLELTAEGAGLDIAIAGGGFDVKLGDTALPACVALHLLPGQRLVLRAGPVNQSGSWASLAVGADIDLPPMLGSLATHTRTGFGGLEGRGLRAGDLVPLRDVVSKLDAAHEIIAPWLGLTDRPIRVVLGPQDDYFAPDQIAAFFAREWRLSPQSYRMAYALEGERLFHAKGHDIVSDGVVHGAIQVPGSGLPFVLMADRQPTGGYPKIATVIGADLGSMAQRRPGSPVCFASVTVEAAVAARTVLHAAFAGGISLVPLRRGVLSSQFLLSQNLISGAISAIADRDPA
jgi:biotin-dependent carboxylase-like uncharacterized protein